MDVKRIFEGLTIVAVGAILLANTTGILPWSVWWNILRLWPILLIAAGIDLIGRNTDNMWLRALSSLLVIGGLAWGALFVPSGGSFWSWATNGPGGETTSFELSEPRDPRIDSATADIDVGVGKVTIESASELFSAAGESPFGDPEFSVATKSNRADARFRTSSGSTVGWWPGRSVRFFADIGLGTGVAWEIKVDAGAADLDIDLEDVEVDSLELDTGAASGTITLGTKARELSVSVDAGASSFTIRVPEEADVVVTSRSGVSAVQVDDEDAWDQTKRGDSTQWVTKDSAGARTSIEIDLKLGAASVDIVRY